MAAACHVRSSSLPSKSHPLASSVEEQLTTLRASSASVTYKLGGLKDLHDRVDDLFQLPHTQQALSSEHQDKCLEEMFDGSLRLLDACATTRDVFSQMKECVQELEFSFRRKRGAESNFENEVQAYMNSRKRMSKVISKYCGNLKRMEKKCTELHVDKDSVVVVGMLKEVEEISLMVFQSLLSSVSLSKARSRPAGWSIVSKLLPSRQITCQDGAYANAVEKMDVELLNLIGKTATSRGGGRVRQGGHVPYRRPENALKGDEGAAAAQPVVPQRRSHWCPTKGKLLAPPLATSLVEMKSVLEGLEALECSIEQTEEELECIYRRLLKSRVSLLNMHA